MNSKLLILGVLVVAVHSLMAESRSSMEAIMFRQNADKLRQKYANAMTADQMKSLDLLTERFDVSRARWAAINDEYNSVRHRIREVYGRIDDRQEEALKILSQFINEAKKDELLSTNKDMKQLIQLQKDYNETTALAYDVLMVTNAYAISAIVKDRDYAKEMYRISDGNAADLSEISKLEGMCANLKSSIAHEEDVQWSLLWDFLDLVRGVKHNGGMDESLSATLTTYAKICSRAFTNGFPRVTGSSNSSQHTVR